MEDSQGVFPSQRQIQEEKARISARIDELLVQNAQFLVNIGWLVAIIDQMQKDAQELRRIISS